MKKIKLTQGRSTLIDNEDFEFLNQWKWRFNSKVGAVHRKYLKKVDGKWLFEEWSIHRLLTNCPKEKTVDHKNGNFLDNQKGNLRGCTHAENSLNRKISKRNKSGYKGVLWCNWHKKWRAIIMRKSKAYYIGYFYKKEEAARAYDRMAKELHGEFARLNFPR